MPFGKFDHEGSPASSPKPTGGGEQDVHLLVMSHNSDNVHVAMLQLGVS
jgi:hypothetical protein